MNENYKAAAIAWAALNLSDPFCYARTLHYLRRGYLDLEHVQADIARMSTLECLDNERFTAD